MRVNCEGNCCEGKLPTLPFFLVSKQTVYFADATTLYLNFKTFLDVSDEINIDIKRLQEWLKVNRLSLNIFKTKFIVLSNKSITNNTRIKFSNRTIEQVHSNTFFGVTIDQNVSFHVH